MHHPIEGCSDPDSENRFAQEAGEVTIGCVGIYVNDLYALTAHGSMCTRQLHGLFQEIYTNICLKYQEISILDNP
jgi:hypothetical protein